MRDTLDAPVPSVTSVTSKPRLRPPKTLHH